MAIMIADITLLRHFMVLPSLFAAYFTNNHATFS